MTEINRHIEILLLSNDCVIVPGFGGFMAHHVDARYDGRDGMFLPPLRTVGFNPQLTMNDSLLALSYVETYDLSYPEALRRIESEVTEIQQSLENEGKYEVSNVGVLSLNEEGNIEFEPCEAGILTPDFYGLGGFEMTPIAQITTNDATSESVPAAEVKAQSTLVEETQVLPLNAANASAEDKASEKSNTVFLDEDDTDDEPKAEFISIKKSWLRNLAAACIAIIAFLAFSTPLGSPTMQQSQIDTGMLTRLAPKEIRQIMKVGELAISNSNGKNNAEVSETSANASETKMPVEDSEQQIAPTTYYCIVLASRVSKHNAANYVERLQNQGFKQTRVHITPHNVKVIYGNYRTENEAYTALNKLRSNEVFEDGWITKIKEEN